MMHDRADTIDAGFGIPGLAIPNAPVQPLIRTAKPASVQVA